MKTKPKKLSFIAEVRLKGKKTPCFGIGKGVVLRQEIEFKDERGLGFKHPMFLMSKIDEEARLKDEAVEVVWTPVTPRQRKTRK